MGGFLSALGNMTAGAGEAAGEYSKQQRDLFHQTKMEGVRQIMELLKNHAPDSADFQYGSGLLSKTLNAQAGDENNHTLLGTVMKWARPHPNTITAMQQAGIPGAGPPPPPTKAPAGPAAVGAQPGAAQYNPTHNPALVNPVTPTKAKNGPLQYMGTTDNGDLYSYDGGFNYVVQNPGNNRGGAGTGAAAPGAADTSTSSIKYDGEPAFTPVPDTPQGLSSGGAAQPGSSPLTSPQGTPHIPPVNDPSTANMSVTPGGPMTMGQPAAAQPSGFGSSDDLERFLDPRMQSWKGDNWDIHQAKREAILKPYREQQARMLELQSIRKMDLGERQRTLQNIMGNAKLWGDLPPQLQAEWQAWASSTTAPLPSMAASLMRPMTFPGVRPSSSVPPDQLVNEFGEAIDGKANPYVREHLNLMTGRRYFSASTGAESQGVNGKGELVTYPRLPGVAEAPGGGPVYPTSFATPRNAGVDARTGQKIMSGYLGMIQGLPGAYSQGVDPSFVPTTTSGPRLITTVNDDGDTVQKFVDVSTTRSKGSSGAGLAAPVNGAPAGTTGAAGAPAGAGAGGARSVPAPVPPRGNGGREFIKPLTPEQHLKAEQQVNQYSIAIDRAQSVMQRLPLLNSLLDAKKIDLQIDPHQGVIKALINRTVPLSPEEEQLAGDFQTLMEDINLVRGPMGATGFRGPEAFAALQAQRGTLLGRPGVTRTVLTNTLRALRGQRDPLAKQLGLRNSGGQGRGGGGRGGDQVVPPVDAGDTALDRLRNKFVKK